MSKRRKVKLSRIIILIVLIVAICCGASFLISLNNKEEIPFDLNSLKINEVNYSDSEVLPIDLYSKEYLLMRLNDFKVLYSKGNSEIIYPASLTKVLTMDCVLEMMDSKDETSSISNEQWYGLIEDNASLAGLYTEKEYSIDDLLKALILPSGGDAALALENYASSKGKNLVDEMNKKVDSLNLASSHFTNPTGLHDDNLFVSLDDYSKIVIDTLLKEDGKKILKTKEYLQDDKIIGSTLKDLYNRNDDIKILGGKTGYTPEAGMNIMVLYEVDNRSYLLLLANAPGSPYKDGRHHIDDVNNILNFLYNN